MPGIGADEAARTKAWVSEFGEIGRTTGSEPNGLGPCREESMQKKCEDCGVWADEEYILDMDGVELCVLCVHQLQVCSDTPEMEGVAE